MRELRHWMRAHTVQRNCSLPSRCSHRGLPFSRAPFSPRGGRRFHHAQLGMVLRYERPRVCACAYARRTKTRQDDLAVFTRGVGLVFLPFLSLARPTARYRSRGVTRPPSANGYEHNGTEIALSRCKHGRRKQEVGKRAETPRVEDIVFHALRPNGRAVTSADLLEAIVNPPPSRVRY